jgi:AraC-like DNA-binding protein
MCISERTLARKLALEGYSFQTLLDESKCELACWLLSYSPHYISVIAERLGYDDDKNFSRSFRRWRNTTPREYRQQRAR